MKSTQDLCIFLKELGSRLGKDVQLLITADKSFNLIDVSFELGEESIVIFDSDDEKIDINDLPYEDVKQLAKTIKDNLSVKDITIEDL